MAQHFVFITIFLTLSFNGYATTLYERPFPEALARAAGVVRGTIVRQYSKWGTGAQKRIYTYTEVKASEVLKGNIDPQGPVFVRELGGEKDGVGMNVPGTARFRRGEDVVVFLGPENPDGSFNVMGMSHGRYEVRKDQTTGEEFLVGAGLSERGQHSGHNHGQDHDDTEGAKKPTSLWTLSRVRTLVRRQKKQGEDRSSEVKAKQSRNLRLAQEKADSQAEVEAPHSASDLHLDNKREAGKGFPGKLLLWAAFVVALMGGLTLWLRRRK